MKNADWRRSIVVRLTLLLVAVVLLSHGALFAILYQSASLTYTEVREEVEQAAAPGEGRVLADLLSGAYQRGGWAAVAALASARPGGSEIHEAPFVAVDAALGLRASTDPRLTGATVTRSGAGTLRLAQSVVGERGVSAIELESPGIPIRDRTGATVGWAIALPAPPPVADGGAFAERVLSGAALWLALVLTLTATLVATVLRRSLRPIEHLTRAADRLEAGVIPAPVVGGAGGEFGRLLAAFNAATRSLAEARRQRREFTADIAHELRTPLTNLRSRIEAAELGLLERDDALLATLSAEVQLLQRLVEDFRTLAAADAGTLHLACRSLPTAEVVRGILEPLAAGGRAELVLDIPEDLAVHADEDRLRQVLGNLFENAARHMSEALQLTVTAWPTRDAHGRAELVLQLEDNGPGVPPEHRTRVFDRLYRVDEARSRRTGGAGLGLAIVRNLVEAMGGSVRCVEVSGGGAGFQVTLPQGRRRA